MGADEQNSGRISQRAGRIDPEVGREWRPAARPVDARPPRNSAHHCPADVSSGQPRRPAANGPATSQSTSDSASSSCDHDRNPNRRRIWPDAASTTDPTSHCRPTNRTRRRPAPPETPPPRPAPPPDPAGTGPGLEELQQHREPEPSRSRLVSRQSQVTQIQRPHLQPIEHPIGHHATPATHRRPPHTTPVPTYLAPKHTKLHAGPSNAAHPVQDRLLGSRARHPT